MRQITAATITKPAPTAAPSNARSPERILQMAQTTNNRTDDTRTGN